MRALINSPIFVTSICLISFLSIKVHSLRTHLSEKIKSQKYISTGRIYTSSSFGGELSDEDKQRVLIRKQLKLSDVSIVESGHENYRTVVYNLENPTTTNISNLNFSFILYKDNKIVYVYSGGALGNNSLSGKYKRLFTHKFSIDKFGCIPDRAEVSVLNLSPSDDQESVVKVTKSLKVRNINSSPSYSGYDKVTFNLKNESSKLIGSIKLYALTYKDEKLISLSEHTCNYDRVILPAQDALLSFKRKRITYEGQTGSNHRLELLVSEVKTISKMPPNGTNNKVNFSAIKKLLNTDEGTRKYAVEVENHSDSFFYSLSLLCEYYKNGEVADAQYLSFNSYNIPSPKQKRFICWEYRQTDTSPLQFDDIKLTLINFREGGYIQSGKKPLIAKEIKISTKSIGDGSFLCTVNNNSEFTLSRNDFIYEFYSEGGIISIEKECRRETILPNKKVVFKVNCKDADKIAVYLNRFNYSKEKVIDESLILISNLKVVVSPKDGSYGNSATNKLLCTIENSSDDFIKDLEVCVKHNKKLNFQTTLEGLSYLAPKEKATAYIELPTKPLGEFKAEDLEVTIGSLRTSTSNELRHESKKLVKISNIEIRQTKKKTSEKIHLKISNLTDKVIDKVKVRFDFYKSSELVDSIEKSFYLSNIGFLEKGEETTENLSHYFVKDYTAKKIKQVSTVNSASDHVKATVIDFTEPRTELYENIKLARDGLKVGKLEAVYKGSNRTRFKYTVTNNSQFYLTCIGGSYLFYIGEKLVHFERNSDTGILELVPGESTTVYTSVYNTSVAKGNYDKVTTKLALDGIKTKPTYRSKQYEEIKEKIKVTESIKLRGNDTRSDGKFLIKIKNESNSWVKPSSVICSYYNSGQLIDSKKNSILEIGTLAPQQEKYVDVEFYSSKEAPAKFASADLVEAKINHFQFFDPRTQGEYLKTKKKVTIVSMEKTTGERENYDYFNLKIKNNSTNMIRNIDLFCEFFKDKKIIDFKRFCHPKKVQPGETITISAKVRLPVLTDGTFVHYDDIKYSRIRFRL